MKTRLFQTLNHSENRFALCNKITISNLDIIADIHRGHDMSIRKLQTVAIGEAQTLR